MQPSGSPFLVPSGWRLKGRMMLPKHSLSVLALGSILAACTLVPPVEVPAPQAPSDASPSAIAATPTPAPSDAASALPASPAAPSATPYQWQPSGVEPVENVVQYEDRALGLTIRDASYNLTGSADTGFTARARMAVSLPGQPATTVTFEEFDRPDTGSPGDEDDSVSITDTRTGDTRTFGADQGLVNLWVGSQPPRLMPLYRVQQEGGGGPLLLPFSFNDSWLKVQFLGGGMVEVNFYACPMTLEEAAMAAAHSPQLKDASVASLATLYTMLRERRVEDTSFGLTSFYRALEGKSPTGTRFIPPPNFSKKTGSKLGRYRTMSEAEVAYNPAAALIEAVLALRMSGNFDPEGGFEAVNCEPDPR